MIFQCDVDRWMRATFTTEIVQSIDERCFRFLEEAAELVQSIGMEKEAALTVIDYVFSREKGNPNQEIGGVMVTLAALANAGGFDLTVAGRSELHRCWNNIDKIREKQAGKPKAVRGKTS